MLPIPATGTFGSGPGLGERSYYLMDFDPGRRVWVKRFLLGTAASMTLPQWAGRVLAEVEEVFPSSATIRLKSADYPILEAPGGSVQIRFNTSVKPMTINRLSPQEFITLDSICTHQGCTVGPFLNSNNCMTCPCHGSRYDIEGRVFRNGSGVSSEPAPNDLSRFETSYDPETDTISIIIPNMALGLNSIQVVPQEEGGVIKVQLRFPAKAGSTYQISRQDNLDGEYTIVPFAIAPGSTDLVSSYTPAVSGFVTAYIDATGPTGFFVVGLVLTPLATP